MAHLDAELDVIITDDDRCTSCGGESPGGGVCPDCLRALKTHPKPARTPEKSDQTTLIMRELARRELARRKFFAFLTYMEPDYVIGWFVKDLAARLDRFVRRVERGESPRMLISVPPRRGKEIADHVPVLTTRGWKRHGDLRPGDHVFHPSGKPVEVIEVHPPGLDTMEVELTTGEVIQCHENHEWTVRDKAHDKWMTVETRWFIDPIPKGGHRGKRRNLWHGKRGTRGGRAAFQLPFVEPLQFPEADLPMDPYVLGAWLGDGTTGACAITHHADDREIIEAVVEAGYSVSSYSVHRTTGVFTTRFGGARPVPGPFTRGLRNAGVYYDKHIPDIYLRGSIEQRLQLLAGLVDTDGHVDSTGRVGFANANKRLVDGVVALIRTFGWRAGVHERAPQRSSSGIEGKQTIYEVRFRPTMRLPLRIPRKAQAQRPLTRRRRIGIRDVRRAARPAVGRCITVAAPDGLYLVGEHLIPTHNSQQASKLLPAWFLGRNPGRSIIATTHSDDLANDNSRDVLAYLASERYQRVFENTRLHKDNKGATGWRTTAGGVYKPAGVGKGIAGRGADILLVDDPHRDKDAFSQTVRDAIWRWFKASARTRLMPGGGIIVIQTRWVVDDLIGRIVSEEGLVEDGGEWEYVRYPEEATDDEYRLPSGVIVHEPVEGAVLLRRRGEVLFPERYPPESNIEHKRDPVTWAALYQQNPTSGEAAHFREEWFEPCTTSDVPSTLVYYTAWDTAVTQRESSAYTAGVVGGVDADGVLWIVDVVRERWDGYEIIEGILDTYVRYREEATGIERTNHAVATKPFMDKRIAERRLHGINVVDLLHGNKDKVARARPIQAMCRAGRVRIPHDAPWYDDFMQELKDFPGGATVDMVDAFAHLGQMIDEMHEPRQHRRKVQARSWRDKLRPARRVKDWRAA